MKFLIHTLLLIVVMSSSAFGHHVFSGQILHAKTAKPIEGALITVESTNQNLLSDANGQFKIKVEDSALITFQISNIGFATQTFTWNCGNERHPNCVIKLEPSVINLAEISISNSPVVNKTNINKLNIARLPIQSAQDMLKAVPGLFIAQHAGGGKAEQIFLRGFDCDHGTDIAIKVDGMPVNMVSHAHGQGYADLHFVIPETVERIDVNKGTYQAAAGDFSTAGNINFTTKKSFDNNSATFEKGMYNYNRLLLLSNLWQNKKSNSSWIFAGEKIFYDGYFDQSMKLNRLNLFSKYQTQLSPATQLQVQGSYFTSNWDASGQIPERSVNNGSISNFGSIDSTEGGNTSRFNLSTTLSTNINNNSKISNQLFYNKYNFNLFSNFTFYKNDDVHGDMIEQKESRDILGYNGTYTNYQHAKGMDFNTQVGVQCTIDQIDNTELSNVQFRYTFVKPISLGDVLQMNSGFYITEEIKLNKKWTVDLGTRFDAFYFSYKDQLAPASQNQSQTKWQFSPKANIYYTPNNQLQFFAKAGKGFHSNDARVVVQQEGLQILPAAFGNEVGAIWKVRKQGMVQLNIWKLDLAQEFVYVGDDAVVEPSTATTRSGLDVSLKYQLHKRLMADIDVTLAKGKFKNEPVDVNLIPLAPRVSSVGGISYSAPSKFKMHLRYRHLGDRAADESNSITAKGYTLLDYVASYPLRKFTIAASVENLLNTKWKEAQFATETKLQNETIPVNEIHFTSGTPLNIKFKVTYNF